MAEAPAPTPGDDAAPGGPGPEQEFVWTFRGYRLRAGEFTTAMVHLFRAEVQRANAWRIRLDTTTNWAVLSTGAAISIAFGQGNLSNHPVIILNTLLVTLFLSAEARRYRYYELWSSRVRLMETDFFASMLVPPFQPSGDWAETLAENLLNPQFPISSLEALGRRYRRNYVWIYLLLAAAWLTLLWLQPKPASGIDQLLERAAVGNVPGWVVVTTGLVFNGALFLIGILTIGLRQASGEVLPRYGALEWFDWQATAVKGGAGAWFRPGPRHRKQLLTLIITDKAATVGPRLLAEMHRGVTELQGRGMYTGHGHSVLMCAITVTEVQHLEAVVREEDPGAFVIVSPVQEIHGSGFTAWTDEGEGAQPPPGAGGRSGPVQGPDGG